MFIEEWVYQQLVRELEEHEPTILGISFYRVQSELFTTTGNELKAYEMPITKIIEDYSVKDIQILEDSVKLMELYSKL